MPVESDPSSSFATCVQAATSQGDTRSGESAGTQCCPIALYALCVSCIKQCCWWRTSTLDTILEHGDTFLKSLGKDRFLGIEDLLRNSLR